MVLDDIAHRARLLVVTGAFFDADRFGDRDLHVVDVLPVPDRLEDPVREPHDEDVLNGLFAEVVIDAEDLVLAEDGVEDLGELPCGLAVMSERLLDDDPGPARVAPQAVLADRSDDARVRRRRRGEIEQPIRVGAELVVEAIERFAELPVTTVVGCGDEMQILREASPHLLIQRFGPAVLRDREAQLLAVRSVA